MVLFVCVCSLLLFSFLKADLYKATIYCEIFIIFVNTFYATIIIIFYKTLFCGFFIIQCAKHYTLDSHFTGLTAELYTLEIKVGSCIRKKDCVNCKQTLLEHCVDKNMMRCVQCNNKCSVLQVHGSV